MFAKVVSTFFSKVNDAYKDLGVLCERERQAQEHSSLDNAKHCQSDQTES